MGTPGIIHRLSPLGDGMRVLLTSAAVVIVLAGLQAARDIIVPVIMACFLAIVSYPITVFLHKKLRFPHWLAVLCTVLADFSALFGIGSLINFLAGSLSTEIQRVHLPLIVGKYTQFMASLKETGWDQYITGIIGSPQEFLSGKMILDVSTLIMNKALTFVTVIVLTLILMTFFLAEAPRFRRNVNKISKEEGLDLLQFANALQGIQRYLLIKTFISLITGLMAWLLCLYMDIDFALLWGIVAFTLNFIPTFGSIAAAIPPILLALLLGTPLNALITAIGYLAINISLGNGLEPILMGKQFGIAMSVVLLSVLLWGWIWGPIGMLLAVPISVLIKLALENSRDLKWIAMLLDNPPTTLPIAKKLPLHPHESQETD
ncbi:MAG: AI-2E family transporter [Akkermansiaceae bacterium]|nr:AI-2E family transporter [Akkermansiaceae bacterium]